MRIRTFLRTLVRYFTNQTHPAFIQDPYHHIIKEERGERVVQKKVGFQELFYDLFVVAVLSVYTSESALSSGSAIGSYILFFSAIWTIWASQTVFDVRYGTRDGSMWIFGYLQLCVYGAWAAISGDFDLSFRLNEAFESQENYAKQDLNHHYFQPQSFATSPAATQRSFKVASGTFATSRIILLLQYAIVLHFAKKHKRQLAPIYCNMLGCLLSGAFWFTAMGLSFRDSEGVRIARIVLWVVGLAVEFGGMVVAAVVQPGLRLDLEYWAERFSALTLIVLGEGIVGTFASFQKALHGVYTGSGSGLGDIAGCIVATIAMYRLLYYLYFGQHSHHIKGGTLLHGLWGALHFPLHLALLLLTQCFIHTILSLNVYAGITALSDAYTQLGVAIYEMPADEFMNTTAWGETMLHTPQAHVMDRVARNFGVDWFSRVGTMVTAAAENATTIQRLFYTEQFTLIQKLFTNYDFEPPEQTNGLVDKVIRYSLDNNTADYSTAYDLYVTLLIRPVYISQQYGVTVLGAFFVCLAGLLCLQHYPSDHRHKRYSAVSRWYRFILGGILLLLSLLYIGRFYPPDSLFTGQVAPIFNYIDSAWYLPSLFLAAATAALVDLGVFIWRQSEEQEVAGRDTHSNLHDLPVLPAADAHDDKEKGLIDDSRPLSQSEVCNQDAAVTSDPEALGYHGR